MLLGTLLAVPSASSVGLQMPPRITTQPRSVLASAGNEPVVFARAYGAGQLSFQWLREGVPMDGAEEPVLRLGSTSAGQAGAYQLVVSNPYGKATSDVARVTMEADGGAGFTPAGLVFCVNAVGYVNVTLQPGLSLVVNPFFVGGMAAVSNVLGPLPNGMAIYQVTSSGFTANAMLSQWTRPDALLPLGEGFFALNPFSFPVTITMVGEVAQGDLQQVLPAAYSIAASLVPLAGGVGSALGMPVAKGDEVWRWDSQTQSYLQYVFPEDAWQPQEPMISVAESFVVRKTATTLWRRIFQVNLLGWCPPPFPSPLSRVPMVSSAGQLHFFTYNPDPALGRVEGVGSDYFGQLYAGLSTNESELMPCGVPVRFFDGERTGYLDGGIVTTGLPAGRDVQVQLRIWRALDGASYEEAAATGCFTSKSELVTARTEAPLVDGQPGKPPRPLNHFRTLRPPQVPGIAIEPANGLVPIGQAATLTAVGAGPGTPSFQWSRNGQSIPNANGPQLVLSNMQRNDAGQYSVTIGNQTCASVSASVQLTVYEPIQILEQPADLDRIAGEMAPFAVLATGEPPLTYSWRTSALDPGLTNRLLNVNAAALVLSNVVDEAEGEYWVEIRSPYETIATSHARLSVTNFLHIALDTPAWRYVTGGDQAWQLTEATYLGRSNIAVAGPIPWSSSARMHAQFEGPGVMNFWWATTARNNELQFLVDGVAKTSLNNRPGWEPASVALPSGSHRLDWKLTHSSAEGQAVTAWVDSVEIRDGVAPKIMSASSNYWFTPGEPVTLSVAAAGDDPLHYQWFAGAAPIPWATANTVLLWPWDIAPELSYSVTVSNYFGVVKSGPMTLQPRPRLRIETQPAGTLRLIWPRVASGFILEASADLRSAASWEVLDHPVVLTEKECAVSVPAEPGTNRWFRLRLP